MDSSLTLHPYDAIEFVEEEEKKYRTPIYIRRNAKAWYDRHREELQAINKLVAKRFREDAEYQEKRRRVLHECREEVRRQMAAAAAANTAGTPPGAVSPADKIDSVSNNDLKKYIQV